MARAIRIRVLPAAYGDCLLVECERPGRPWRMLVDGGPSEAWPNVRAALRRIPASSREIDVLVVSHIDSDHIGGLLPLLADGGLGVVIRDVWFNGRRHLDEGRRGIQQAEDLTAILTGDSGTALPWNQAFQGRAVVTEARRQVSALDNGPRITFLSPPAERLAALRDEWDAEIAKLRGGRSTARAAGRARPDAALDDLAVLAATRTAKDRSVANGSSIAFLLEHRGASCLLSADANPAVLEAALEALALKRGLPRVLVDVFKLPHHGSAANNSTKLLRLVDAKHYVVSTNGDRFNHPDDVAIARVVTTATRPTLAFNHRNARVERWGEPALLARYGHRVAYPRGTTGIVIDLPER